MRLLVLAPLALTACATTPAPAPAPDAPAEPERRPIAGSCNASALQDHIGHTASQQSGAVLLELSGARTLRWLPPDSAVTMDYSPDRLNVGYDRAMKVTRISCG